MGYNIRQLRSGVWRNGSGLGYGPGMDRSTEASAQQLSRDYGSNTSHKKFLLEKKVENGILLHQSDNSMVVSYLNKQGGRIPELSKPVQELWDFCLEKGIEIKSRHIPGDQLLNGVDFLSRMFKKQSEWRLPFSSFQILLQKWGPFAVDLFATQFNCQFTPFLSFWEDPEVMAWML